MSNTTKIDEVVDPVAVKQFDTLKASGELLRKEMVALLETAIKLNATLGGSTPAQFAKNAEASTIATQKLIDAQNKAAISATKLQSAQVQLAAQQARQQAAQDKATASAQKALSPYQQLSKELDNLRAKAKDAGVQFGIHSEQFKSASKPVQELDEKLKGIDRTLGQSQRNVGNYGNIFSGFIRQSIPFGESSLRISENLKSLAGDAEGSAEAVEGLGGAFAGVSVGVFVGVVASATYFLSQFKSVGETTETVMAGLKNAFANFGQATLPAVFGKSNQNVIGAFKSGKDIQKEINELLNKQDVSSVNNAELQAESEKLRALSSDRTADLQDRKKYLKDAQDIEQKILANQKKNADLTIEASLRVAFRSTSLNKKQIEDQKKILLAAAERGDLQPAKDLSLDGLKMTSAGFDLYKQGLQQQIQAKANTANEIVKLQADANNMELRADRALAAAQNALDKARIESVQQASKTILDSTTSSNTQKLRANKDFINQSITLIDVEKKNQLETAGLGTGRTEKDTRVEAITRQSIEQTAQNKITQVRNEGMRTRQAILKNSNDVTSRLNKANIQEQIDNEQLILTNSKATFDEKTKALNEYEENSKKIIKQSQKDAIGAAGLPSDPSKDDPTQKNTRLAINKEFENQLTKVTTDGEKQRLEIHKEYLSKIVTLDQESQQEQLENLDQGAILASQQLDKQKNKLLNDKATERAEGKISEKQYQEAIQDINDAYAIKKIADEITTQEAILAIREATRDKELEDAKKLNASPEELAKITSDSNKGTTPVKNKLGDLRNQLGDAVTKRDTHVQNNKTTDKEDARKKIEQALTDLTVEGINDVNDLRQKSYEAEIARLEKQSQLVQENAQLEKDAINRSLDTQTNKARAIAVLDAQTASKQKAIRQEEAKEKKKAAITDKEATIARIIATGALAIVNAFATQPAYLGIILGAIVSTSVGIELAKAVATPIPQFYKGTPTGGHKGGLAIIGELGSEHVKEPGKPAYYSPGVATMVNLPRGTVVTPHNMLPVTPKWESTRTDNRDVVDGLGRVERAVSGQPKQRGAKLAGWVEAQRQADAWNSYSRNHFK